MEASVKKIAFFNNEMTIELENGYNMVTSLEYYPRLNAKPIEKLSNWKVSPDDQAILWPDLDERLNLNALVFLPPKSVVSRNSQKLFLMGSSIGILFLVLFPHITAEKIKPFAPLILLMSLILAVVIAIKNPLPKTRPVVLKTLSSFYALTRLFR